MLRQLPGRGCAVSVVAILYLFFVGGALAVALYAAATGRKMDDILNPPQLKAENTPQAPQPAKPDVKQTTPAEPGNPDGGVVVLVILGGLGLVWLASELGVGKRAEKPATRPYTAPAFQPVNG